MIETTFYQILINNASITALVGNLIFPLIADDQYDLYITYTKISRRRPLNIDNTASQQSTLFQIDIFGKDVDEVDALKDTVAQALHTGSNSDYADDIQFMRVDSEREDFEKDTKLYKKSLDVAVFFN